MVEPEDKKRIEGAAAKQGFSVKFDGDALEFKKNADFDSKPNKGAPVKPDPILKLVKELSETNKALLNNMADNRALAANPTEWVCKVTRGKDKLLDGFRLTPIY